MLVWIASYPRSGNTLFRMILKECFDLSSYAAGASTNLDDNGFWGAVVGTRRYDTARSDVLQAARHTSEPVLAKTHDETPLAGDRAVYIVRDGRAAIASYQRYLRDFDKVDFSLAELAAGERRAFTWAEHVERWLTHPDTLLLRYEELTIAPPLSLIGDFLGLTPRRRFSKTFDDLHAADPNFFSVGSNRQGVEAVEDECGDLFWRHNGATMVKLGYRRTA
jgi:hypothetical protein